MTIPENIVPSPKDVGTLLGISKLFNINDDPYNKKLTMLYKQVGKMRDIFIKGPSKSVKNILTMDESWGEPFEKTKSKLIDKGVYAFVTKADGEGATIWGLIPDDSFLGDNEAKTHSTKKVKLEDDGDVSQLNKEADRELADKNAETNKTKNDKDKEDDAKDDASREDQSSSLGKLTKFNNTVKGDIKGRRWMTAFNNAQKEMPVGENGQKGAPFAIAFVASYTENSIPWFGKVAWGVAVKNDVISLTQIPLMLQGNKDQYFVWSFVAKIPITDSELTGKFGKGGGESNYSNFKKLRDYLNKECEPLNERGEYSFAKGGEKTTQSPDKSKSRPDEKGKEDSKNKTDTQNKTDNKSETNTQSKTDPLHAAQQKLNQTNTQSINDSYIHSVTESIEIAQSFLMDETYRMYEYSGFGRSSDDDDGKADVGSDRATFPSGSPYLNKIKNSGYNEVPMLGPLY